MLRVKIEYRVDKRIRVVEIKTGNMVFLCDLEEFSMSTGINDFTESVTGEALIPAVTFKYLKDNKVTTAEPHSFRFRRASREDT